MAKTDENDSLPQVKRDLTEAEVRLNVLDLAVRSFRLYGAQRPGATPLDLAATYFEYVSKGKMPKPRGGPTGAAKPMPMDGDFGHGSPPKDEIQGDDITPGRTGAPGAASLRQAGAGQE